MGRLTYKQIREGTISQETLQRLFTVISDDRTASLAIWYVTLHDADDKQLDEARAVLKGIRN